MCFADLFLLYTLTYFCVVHPTLLVHLVHIVYRPIYYR